MGAGSQEAVKQLRALIDQIDEPLRRTFENIHQGYPNEVLARFLKAREWNVPKAYKMLTDCLNWRIQNDIDNILAKPIVPAELYKGIRDSQLIGLSGYSRAGIPVFAIGVGQSTFDKASERIKIPCSSGGDKTYFVDVLDGRALVHHFTEDVNYYVQSHIQINEYRDRVVLPAATNKQGWHIGTCVKVLDMTGLKLSALSQVKLLTIISTVDDLNYPEKTDTYYIVNAPYIFSACWKVVKPLLQERTRRKVQVLQGCGRDELLKIMDYSALPHFCRREGSGSSRHSNSDQDDCYSLNHPFHQQLYSYIKGQSRKDEMRAPIKQGSLHLDIPSPDPEELKIAETIKSEFLKLDDRNGLSKPMNGLAISGD